MTKKIAILIFSIIILFKGYSQDVFGTIETNIAGQLLAPANDLNLAKSVIGFLHQQKADGSWPDINYADQAITKWNVGNHLVRIKNFAMAYIRKENVYFKNKDVYNGIVNGLRFWYEADPKSSNWWHNDIATPQALGEILILMKHANLLLSKDLEAAIVERMKRGDIIKQTGANKLDIAIHYLYRAVITKDGEVMDTAVQQAFQPIAFTTREGLQYDYSYLQHGPQLQIGSYGLVFLNGEYKVASWLIGTPYALSAEKSDLLDYYLTKTFLTSIRGRYSDFNIEGRGISRPDILDYRKIAAGKPNTTLLGRAKMVNQENFAVIESAIQRIRQSQPESYNISPVHHYYWIGDYTQHQRPAYNFNVRTVSDRTKRTEAGNKENLLGKFLPDGSTNIQRRGDEYFNIMPVWEWDKIPGITSRDFAEDQPVIVQWGEPGSTSFVGGVSDGRYGTTVYDMNYDGVKAKKAWFFFDDEIVNLGAGINSNAPEHLVTTVNQCWQKGKVVISENKKTRNLKKSHSSGAIDWIWHDSIGYYFPSDLLINVSNDLQRGCWKKINAAYSDNEISGQVFKAWIDHGIRPDHSVYAYTVIPGVSQNDMKLYDTDRVIILSNNTSVQAVQHKKLQIIQSVFYKAGKLSAEDLSIEADKPCVTMIKREGQSFEVYVSDPTHELKEVNLTINAKEAGAVKVLYCVLPAGTAAGSTVRLTFSL